MKAKLIKVDNGWVLMIDNIMYATDNDKLSLKNCQAIERGYDLDELAKKFAIEQLANPNEYATSIYAATIENTYMHGFQKALELMGDKKFSEDDLRLAMHFGKFGEANNQTTTIGFIQSLQQTEWEVEIEMEPMNLDEIREQGKGFLNANTNKPKLDADGCLILKTFKSE